MMQPHHQSAQHGLALHSRGLGCVYELQTVDVTSSRAQFGLAAGRAGALIAHLERAALFFTLVISPLVNYKIAIQILNIKKILCFPTAISIACTQHALNCGVDTAGLSPSSDWSMAL